MDAQTYISNHIQNGYDLVLGEDHRSISTTMNLIEDAVRDNPDQVKAIVLELSPYVQEPLDRIGSDEMSRENFILQARLNSEQEYLDLAGGLLESGRINQEQYDWYEDFINVRVEDITAREFGYYTEEEYLQDQTAFGAVYDMALAAHENSIPVIANNHGRERAVLSDLNDLTVDDWVEYTGDRLDFEDVSNRIDINAPGSVLVHRGAQHMFNIDGPDHQEGFDDLLEQSGRNVRTIGVYDSHETLASIDPMTAEMGLQISDPSDIVIIGGDLQTGSEIDLPQVSTPLALSPMLPQP